MVVGSAPIQYSPIPIEEGHSHATLIATCAAPNAAFTVPTVKNWRDLVEHVGKNPSLAFYNVQTADPCARHAQLTTKFRLIENESAYVELFFALEVGQLFQTLDEANFLFFRPWASRRLVLTHR